MSMKNFIYEWTNVRNGMKYLGSHTGYEDDGYKGSGLYFKRAYNKEPENFKRKILFYVNSRNELLELEENILNSIDALNNEGYYNLSNSAGGGNNHSHLSDQRRNEIYRKMCYNSKKSLESMSVEQKEELKKKKQQSWKISEKRLDHSKKTRQRRILEEKNKTDEEKHAMSKRCSEIYWSRPEEEISEHHKKQSEGVKKWYQNNPEKYEERKKFLKSLNVGKIYITKDCINKRIFPKDLPKWENEGWTRGMYRKKRKS